MSTGGINRPEPAGVQDLAAEGFFVSPPSPQPVASAPAEQRVSPQPGEVEAAANPEYAKKVAEAINSSPDFRKVEAKVFRDEASQKYVLLIFSRTSGQLIRQYPPEGIIQLASKLKAGTLGSFLDEVA